MVAMRVFVYLLKCGYTCSLPFFSLDALLLFVCGDLIWLNVSFAGNVGHFRSTSIVIGCSAGWVIRFISMLSGCLMLIFNFYLLCECIFLFFSF